MSPELSPSSSDTLVQSATGELARVLRDLTRQLEQDHARRLEEALAAARAEGQRATEAAVERATAALRDEFDRERQRLADQHAAAVTDLEARLREEATAALTSQTTEAEQRVRAEMQASIAEAVAEAERRGRAEGDEALARATQDVEQRVRTDAEAALRLAQETFERRLAAAEAAAAAGTSAGATGASSPADRAGEREIRLELLERVLRAVERLDASSSLREALDALADAVALEAPRSLVWMVRGDRLRGWRAAGISGVPADFANVDLHLASAGPFARAVASPSPVTVHANALAAETGGVLSWLDLSNDQAGLVVPVTVDGRVVALVYADDGGSAEREVPGSWPESVQLLARHAARVLEVLTVRRASAARAGTP
jgi:hypothetical protein